MGKRRGARIRERLSNTSSPDVVDLEKGQPARPSIIGVHRRSPFGPADFLTIVRTHDRTFHEQYQLFNYDQRPR